MCRLANGDPGDGARDTEPVIIASYNEVALKATLAASPGMHEELSRQAQRVIVKVQENLSTPWPPPGEPGKPPHLRTGLLRSSIEPRTQREGDDIGRHARARWP